MFHVSYVLDLAKEGTTAFSADIAGALDDGDIAFAVGLILIVVVDICQWGSALGT